MKYIYKTTILLFLIPLASLGNHHKKKHEKSKSIHKEFKVNANAKVSVNNKYGTIKVTTWNKNVVEIDIKITVKGNDIDNVEDKLEAIDVTFSNTSDFVNAKTIIGSKKTNWSWWGKHKKINYQIDYLVKMPITNEVNLSNDYGAISLDEINGNATINCDYGKITIGDLKGNTNSINLDYCSESTIHSMTNGFINTDYSKLVVDTAQKIDLNTDYSTIKFEKLTNLSFNADYGSITVGESDTVAGNGDYTGLKFGTITGSLKIRSDYGYIKIQDLANGFDFIDINSEYAGIKIGTSPSNNFNFTIELQYAGFKQKNSPNITLYKSISKSHKKYYEGVYGKGKPTSKMIIKSEFGSVSFKEN
ncbi:MAG: hypothetical protein GKR88_17585 [Flavobacteriaceae bacterium]|nr:MAG: hypothetical protein GKR88_17585 [Flavobacteriaceae bacterium]